MRLTSSAFEDHGSIPARHTADGPNVSPPLSWSDVPPKAKSLALIVEDPDAPDPAAPKVVWSHWIVYNLPPDSKGLPEKGPLPDGALEGLNDWKKSGWGGPSPPIGRHRYFFRLFALDVVLPRIGRPTKTNLEQEMKGHILASTELVGTYSR